MRKEAKHTPWKVVERNVPIADTGDYDGVTEIIASNGDRLAQWLDEDRGYEYAHLFAAAPELLEVARMVQEQLISHMQGAWPGTMSITAKRVGEALAAAIAKAGAQ